MDENTYRDKQGILRFTIGQRYLLPINEKEGEGSVTYVAMQVVADAPVLPFYWNFRRWLKGLGMPPVQYCYEAQILEVLQCVEYPVAK